jgi:hypothetical protein
LNRQRYGEIEVTKSYMKGGGWMGGGGWMDGWLVFVKFKDRSEPINKLNSAEDRL